MSLKRNENATSARRRDDVAVEFWAFAKRPLNWLLHAAPNELMLDSFAGPVITTFIAASLAIIPLAGVMGLSAKDRPA